MILLGNLPYLVCLIENVLAYLTLALFCVGQITTLLGHTAIEGLD